MTLIEPQIFNYIQLVIPFLQTFDFTNIYTGASLRQITRFQIQPIETNSDILYPSAQRPAYNGELRFVKQLAPLKTRSSVHGVHGPLSQDRVQVEGVELQRITIVSDFVFL